jgi:hypothetical protein
MSQLWIDIEGLVLDGVLLSPAKGTRLAALTQMALERLLRARGLSTGLRGSGGIQETESQTYGAQMKSSPADERQWADELAEILYRAIDRSAA